MLNVFIRSLLVSFLVALPSPLLIDWMVGLPEVETSLARFFATYVLIFIACLLMGISALRQMRDSDNGAEVEDETDDASRETGTVKWFNAAKGFGFITRSNGEDVFVHFRSIRGKGRRSLADGQNVCFKVTQSDKGLQAEDVTIKR